MNNSFGIFAENLEHSKDLICELANQCKKIGDTVLFTDSIHSNEFTDYAIFPSFYMRFFQGVVIFLNIEDHTQHKDIIIGKPMLYLTEQMLKENKIDGSMINKSEIFSASGGYS
jgi:hypothetical protein